MEEKDTAIALLEISDSCHGHREKIVELQEQKNILMKMIKQHVRNHVYQCIVLSSVPLAVAIANVLFITSLKH